MLIYVPRELDMCKVKVYVILVIFSAQWAFRHVGKDYYIISDFMSCITYV